VLGTGELRKASSSVDTSTWHTLTGVNELVDKVFPPISTKKDEDIPEREEFNDYNYWHKTPVMIVESGMHHHLHGELLDTASVVGLTCLNQACLCCLPGVNKHLVLSRAKAPGSGNCLWFDVGLGAPHMHVF
jgi:hypothetical protein